MRQNRGQSNLPTVNEAANLQTMPSAQYAIEPVITEAGVSNLQEDWNRLSHASEFPNVFTTFDWFQAWYKRFPRARRFSKRRPNVLTLKTDGKIVGIAPLILLKTFRLGVSARQLKFVAREWDYNDLVLGNEPEDQTTAVMEYLAERDKEWDLIDLRDLRDTGGSIARITSALTRANLPFRLLPEEERCPFMLIDGPWSEILSRRSASTRHAFRNRQSRLDRMSAEGLRMRIIHSPQDEPDLLKKMIAIEAQKHVGGELSPPFLGLFGDVFVELFDKLGPQGWISVGVMELDDRLLGWHLLFRCGGKLWGYLTAYDHAFSRLSPGTMLVPTIIDYGFSHGFTEYDYLSGEESYKMQWTTGFHHTYRLLVWNRRWTSRLRAFVGLGLRPGNQPDSVQVAGLEESESLSIQQDKG